MNNKTNFRKTAPFWVKSAKRGAISIKNVNKNKEIR